MKVLILGGTRFLGKRFTELLVDAGAEVVLFHRGMTGGDLPGSTTVIGDRSSPEGLEGIRGMRPDAVVDFSSYFSEWTRLTLDIFGGRAGHYVYVSSGAVYQPLPEIPWPETAPLTGAPHWGTYAREKVASELMLWEAHRTGIIPVTIFRFPFILGPANFADRESFVFSRVEAGRPILLPGGGQAINQFVYLEDAARAMVAALMQRDASAGHAFNCAFRRGVTNRGFVELCADILGIEADIVPIDERELGVSSEAVDLTDLVFPYPNHHYLLDTTLLKQQLGVEAQTDNRRMIEVYAAWWLTSEDHAPRPYPREERALKLLQDSGKLKAGSV